MQTMWGIAACRMNREEYLEESGGAAHLLPIEAIYEWSKRDSERGVYMNSPV